MVGTGDRCLLKRGVRLKGASIKRGGRLYQIYSCLMVIQGEL